MRVVIWGTGFWAKAFMERKSYYINDEIVAFVDNNAGMWGKKFNGRDVIPPARLEGMEFDRIVICSKRYDEIKRQAESDLHIGGGKISTYFEEENRIKNEIVLRYRNSQDEEIQKVLDYYEKHSLNVFGYYDGDEALDMLYPVRYDDDRMAYIWFEGKKMFFPRAHEFAKIDDIEYVRNILYEQGRNSPHVYITSEDVVKDGMVIVDGGVCEGNFALRYADIAGKIYLIESDPKWIEALEKTFAPYRDKTVIVSKLLSGEDTDSTVTLDNLVSEKIDILKLDIEGHERDALKGAERVLRESSAYCAVCSYHRHGDEREITALLKEYGYQTSTSQGYMFFPYGGDMVELRKGVVYGSKR